MKRIMTIREKSMLKNGILGAAWITMGIAEAFQLNIAISLITAIVLFGASVLMFVPDFVKTEPEDEMAKYNESRARVSVYEFLILGMLICFLIFSLNGTGMVDLKLIMPFLIGGVNLAEFIFFIVYEKAGA